MKEDKSMQPQRIISAALVLALLAPFAPHASAQQQPAQQQQAQQQQAQEQQPAQPDQQSQQPAPANQPDTPNAPAPAQQPAVVPGLETRTDTAPQPVRDNPNARPVGTAAAPVTRPTGIAASRPAGAAIAPAKQRRVKPIVIRVAIIVAGAAAIGAVAGLSRSSSSRP